MTDQGIESRNETYREIIGRLPEKQRLVLRSIQLAGERGATLDEVCESLGMQPNQISGRVTELKKKGLVKHTEMRRMTRSGGTASVIVSVEAKQQRLF